jgi:hypothetical protein
MIKGALIDAVIAVDVGTVLGAAITSGHRPVWFYN